MVTALWRTWSPDAIIADQAAGVFAAKDKVRPVSYHGEFFSVEGGSTVPPSEQGLPVIFQAGASDDGLDLAARHADATFVSAMTLEVALDYRRRLDAASVVRTPGRPGGSGCPRTTSIWMRRSRCTRSISSGSARTTPKASCGPSWRSRRPASRCASYCGTDRVT